MASLRAGLPSCKAPSGTCSRPFTHGLSLTSRRRWICRAEKDGAVEQESRPVVTTSTDDEGTVRSDVQKAAEPRRALQQQGSSQSNIIQGALEEAQLITWPTPQKAFVDTVLVLGIVALCGSLLFGLNVLLAEASDIWYHSHDVYEIKAAAHAASKYTRTIHSNQYSKLLDVNHE